MLAALLCRATAAPAPTASGGWPPFGGYPDELQTQADRVAAAIRARHRREDEEIVIL